MPRLFTVTHPFHPLSGQTFEALVVLTAWGSERVSYLDADGRARSLPVEWTDVAPVDPVVAIAAGRALFRLCDLVALRAIVSRVGAHETPAAGGGSPPC